MDDDVLAGVPEDVTTTDDAALAIPDDDEMIMEAAEEAAQEAAQVHLLDEDGLDDLQSGLWAIGTAPVSCRFWIQRLP